jgi:hypothetical protein
MPRVLTGVHSGPDRQVGQASHALAGLAPGALDGAPCGTPGTWAGSTVSH